MFATVKPPLCALQINRRRLKWGSIAAPAYIESLVRIARCYRQAVLSSHRRRLGPCARLAARHKQLSPMDSQTPMPPEQLVGGCCRTTPEAFARWQKPRLAKTACKHHVSAICRGLAATAMGRANAHHLCTLVGQYVYRTADPAFAVGQKATKNLQGRNHPILARITTVPLLLSIPTKAETTILARITTHCVFFIKIYAAETTTSCGITTSMIPFYLLVCTAETTQSRKGLLTNLTIQISFRAKPPNPRKGIDFFCPSSTPVGETTRPRKVTTSARCQFQ